MKKRILWIVVDIAAATLIMVGVWGFNYLIPQKGVSAVPMQSSFTKKHSILSRKNSVLIMSYRLLCTLMKSM